MVTSDLESRKKYFQTVRAAKLYISKILIHEKKKTDFFFLVKHKTSSVYIL